MKKITISNDGIPRLTLKIETRIGAYDMAVHLISRLRYEADMSPFSKDDETLEDRDARIENFLKAKLSSMKDGEILEMVQDSILNDGSESPYYAVSDEGYGKAVNFLTDYLVRKYKGFAQASKHV
jgi:hypothetical protein